MTRVRDNKTNHTLSDAEVQAQSKTLVPPAVQTADIPTPVSFGDSASVDAFGRLRVSNPTTLFDSKLLDPADAGALFFDAQLTEGSGITFTVNTSDKPYIDILAAPGANGTYVRQTKRRFNYQPGKSHNILMTGVLSLSGESAGVNRKMGYFDASNGIFIQESNGVIGVTIRSHDSGSPVNTTVTQRNWNLDTLDGSGKSGVTVDWTQAQIFVMDFQWLSVGRVRFGLEIGGTRIYFHEFLQANNDNIPYMSQPNLPIRYELTANGTGTGESLRLICCAVVSEGGADPVGLTSASGTTNHVDANTADTWYALVGVKLKENRIHCEVDPELVSVLAETNDNFEWGLWINPTITGTFTFNDLNNSCCQVAVGGGTGATLAGGTRIASGFAAARTETSIDIRTLLKIGTSIDGTRDELILAARPLSANADIQGSLGWRELH